MDKKEFNESLAKAHKLNIKRDKSEKKMGFIPNSDTETASQIRTAILAIESSIKVGLPKDIQTLFEAISLLDITHKQLSGRYFIVGSK